jgi:hypothetical protein
MAKRNCESCGANVPKDRQFCGSCGTELPPVAPKKPVSKKAIGVVVGAIVGIAALVGAYLVFFPAPLGAKDIRIGLNLPVSEDLWDGAEVDVSSKVTFYAKRDTEYTVVIETKNSTMTDWSEFTTATGTYPEIEVSKPAEILQGINSFRVLVYATGEPKPIATGEEQSLQAKKAYLPETCPTDDINHAWGTTENDTMEEFGRSTKGHKDCTIGLPNSDYIVPIHYYESSAKKFAALKKKYKGKTIKLSLGETGAFKYWIPQNELGGAYWAYVVNFHNIVIDTEMTEQDLGILVDAILVK